MRHVRGGIAAGLQASVSAAVWQLGQYERASIARLQRSSNST
jgi:hypothetical protein